MAGEDVDVPLRVVENDRADVAVGEPVGVFPDGARRCDGGADAGECDGGQCDEDLGAVHDVLSLSCMEGAAGLLRVGEKPGRVGSYSYWSASRTLSREARRAGRTAARIPAITATAVKITSCVNGTWNEMPWLASASREDRGEEHAER